MCLAAEDLLVAYANILKILGHGTVVLDNSVIHAERSQSSLERLEGRKATEGEGGKSISERTFLFHVILRAILRGDCL